MKAVFDVHTLRGEISPQGLAKVTWAAKPQAGISPARDIRADTLAAEVTVAVVDQNMQVDICVTGVGRETFQRRLVNLPHRMVEVDLGASGVRPGGGQFLQAGDERSNADARAPSSTP